MRGRAAKKARIDSFFKPKAPAATRGPVTWDAPKRTNPVSTNLEVKPTVDDAGLVTIQLPKNRVGLWFLAVWKSQYYGAFALNHCVVLHAIDATPARWRGDAGSSPLDRARTAASSPRNDLVKNCRVHPTHWLISTQVWVDGRHVVVR